MNRDAKALLYENVARIGKAISSPKRLEMLELLAQGEKSVEQIAHELNIDVRLASAHLRGLREARMVVARRDGKYMIYRLSGDDIAALWVKMCEVAETHLVELRVALELIASEPHNLSELGRVELLEKARSGEVIVIDVRPADEYQTAHLPYAQSMPLAELEQRLSELPRDREIVAYCRGPFCVLSEEAARLLTERGYRIRRIADGVHEWLAAGLPVERSTASR
jgi:rhodanese-related sulfurtransferase